MESVIVLLQFFSGKDFSVPLWEVMLLVLINSFCLLFGRHRLGLIVSYLFVLYWGFIFNRGYFVDMLGHLNWGLYVYGISGIVMAIIFLISFFVKTKVS
jgi:hypothetical protein